MKKLVLLLLVILIISLMTSTAFSQNYKTIKGYVHDKGFPEVDCMISLVKIIGDPVFVTYSDYNGYFEFRIPNDYTGTLFLIVFERDYKPLKRRLEFPLKNNLYFDLKMEYDGHGRAIRNLWKDPDTVFEEIR